MQLTSGSAVNDFHHDALEMMTAPYCDGCGVSISADQNFCIKCGRTLASVSARCSASGADLRGTTASSWDACFVSTRICLSNR